MACASASLFPSGKSAPCLILYSSFIPIYCLFTFSFSLFHSLFFIRSRATWFLAGNARFRISLIGPDRWRPPGCTVCSAHSVTHKSSIRFKSSVRSGVRTHRRLAGMIPSRGISNIVVVIPYYRQTVAWLVQLLLDNLTMLFNAVYGFYQRRFIKL